MISKSEMVNCKERNRIQDKAVCLFQLSERFASGFLISTVKTEYAWIYLE